MINMKYYLFPLLLLLLIAGCGTPDGSPEIIERERLGQMILVGFRGTEIDTSHTLYKDLRERNIGGVFLTGYDHITGDSIRNISNPTQLLQLSSSLITNSKIPPIIAVSQEGGNQSPLGSEKGFPDSRNAAILGKINREDTTRQYARNMAQEFMVVGVNTNFAPVAGLQIADSESASSRQFSEDPEEVIKQASYVLSEYDKEGILSVLKYFPGYAGLPDEALSESSIPEIQSKWSGDYLEPYRRLFEKHQIYAVQTAPVFNSQIDTLWPSALSDKTVNGLLRDSLGFSGVVFTPNLQSPSLWENYDLETLVEQSLKSGSDILVFENNRYYDEDIAQKAIDVIQKLLREGKLKKETVERSLARIDTLKQEVIAELCTCLNL